jgi:hypothetical protein
MSPANRIASMSFLVFKYSKVFGPHAFEELVLTVEASDQSPKATSFVNPDEGSKGNFISNLGVDIDPPVQEY